MFFIYKHTLKNGAFLIGIGKEEDKIKWDEIKRYKPNKDFYKAITLEGWNNMEHEILASDIAEAADARNEVANYFFKFYDECNQTFNTNKYSLYICPELNIYSTTLVSMGEKCGVNYETVRLLLNRDKTTKKGLSFIKRTYEPKPKI